MSLPDYVTAETELRAGEPEPTVYIVGSPIVIAANAIAAALIEIIGPFSWAALVVLYVFSQFPSR